jgi:adenylyl cyclase-associated protein
MFSFLYAGDNPSLKAYDKFSHSDVYKLADTCEDLGDMGNLGQLLVEVFDGMRYVLILASRAKQPDDLNELQPHLKPITDAVSKIRGLRLKREYDNHIKALGEMLGCVFWVSCRAPSQLPAPFVKEHIGSSDFWSNRIRKEYKGKEAPLQLAFCDNMKKLLTDLTAYIQEYHTTGLTFNPKGVSIAEAAIVLTDNPLSEAAAAATLKAEQKTHKRAIVVGNTVNGGNLTGMMAELAGRRTAEGSSAATGLKHVS